MTDDPTCLNSNECFLTLKPVNFSDQLLQSLSLHTLIIDRQGLHAHQFHRNVCRSKSFQLYSHDLQLHKHTNAQYLYRSHLTLDRTTKTKPQSLPLILALLVILTKWKSRTCLLLQCAFLESCRTPKKTKTSPLVPHMLIPWRDSKPATTRSAQRKEDQLQQLPSYLQRLLSKNLKNWIPPCLLTVPSLKDPSPFFPSTPKLLIQAFIFRYKTLAAQIITPPSSSFPPFRRV